MPDNLLRRLQVIVSESKPAGQIDVLQALLLVCRAAIPRCLVPVRRLAFRSDEVTLEAKEVVHVALAIAGGHDGYPVGAEAFHPGPELLLKGTFGRH